MANEGGEWIMRGLPREDPRCIHTVEEAENFIEKVGFLPLFANGLPGFSLEEHTAPECWWCDDPALDPWIWRQIIAGGHRIAYGKFFDKKAGFISKKWLPYFVNFRRDGYDFDARWDDELASIRQKKIMDVFERTDELFSFELKEASGFFKGGEKNFEGNVTDLQMQLYLCMSCFKRRRNKKGGEYGWSIAKYAKPETVFGKDLVTSAYTEEPSFSRARVIRRLKKLYPDAPEKLLNKVIG